LAKDLSMLLMEYRALCSISFQPMRTQVQY